MAACRRLASFCFLLCCFWGQCLGQDGTFQAVFLLNATDQAELDKLYQGFVQLDVGYQVFMERYNELYPDGFPLGNGPHRFHLNYTRAEYAGSSGKSMAQAVDDQVALGRHFLFGWGDPGLEVLADDVQRIALSCCDARELERHHEHYFQMTPPFESGLYLLMNLLVLRGIQNVSVIYPTDMPEYAEGCLRAISVVPEFQSSGLRVASIHGMKSRELSKPATMKEIVAQVKEANAEMVAGCIKARQAELFVKEQWKAELPLKVRFFGEGPQEEKWIKRLGPRSLDVLSYVGWHQSANLTGLPFFDSVGNFTSRLGFGTMDIGFQFPAEAASMFVLLSAIQQAFEGCDTTATGGNISALLNDTSAISCEYGKTLGYDRILQTLELADVQQTVYGPVSFDKNHKNSGLGDVLIQVVDNNGSYENSVVFPLQIANNAHELKMPGSNPFKPDKCPKGTFRGVDEFNPCPKCPLGTFSDAPDKGFCQECSAHEYALREEGQTECWPCPELTERSAASVNVSCEYQDGLGRTFCDRCDLPTRGKNITCLNCEETRRGQRVRGVSICDCQCSVETYHPQGLAGEPCLFCPYGATCDGQAALPIPNKNFWGDATFRQEMYECANPEACPGGASFLCAEEYTGTLCADCKPGYYKVADFCWECRYKGAAVVVLLSVFFLWRGINLVIAARVETVELMLNFVQLANIIGSLPLNWPQSLTMVFGIAGALDFDIDVAEPSCFVSWSFGRSFFVQLGIPILLSLLALFWFLFGILRYYTSRWYRHRHNWFMRCFRVATVYRWDIRRMRRHGRDFRSVEFDKLIAQAIAALEITYLTTTRYCLDVFSCHEVAGVSVLSESPDTICGSDEHNRLRVFAVFGLVLYTGGYLLFVVFKLAAMHRKKSFMAAQNVRRYGFIYERFELDYTWAAILTLVVRILFVALRVLVNDPVSAVGGMLVVTMVWLFIHIYTLPYVKDQLDLLQSFFLVCLVTFAISGLLFSCGSLPATSQNVLETGVLAIVAVMFITTVFFFTNECLQKIRISVIKKRHRKAVASAIAKGQRLEHGVDCGDHGNMELYSTVDSTFLYRWLKSADHNKLLQFDRLSEMLGGHLSDDAPCSYLSLEMTAKFWRALALAFPELIDFLAMANEEGRSQFVHLMETLYRNFFLTKQMGEDNLWSHIDWKDRGAMMQWLAIASADDRRLFGDMIADGVRHNASNAAAERLARKLEQHAKGRYAPEVDASESGHGGMLQRLFSHGCVSRSAREEISSGRGLLAQSIRGYTRSGSGGFAKTGSYNGDDGRARAWRYYGEDDGLVAGQHGNRTVGGWHSSGSTMMRQYGADGDGEVMGENSGNRFSENMCQHDRDNGGEVWKLRRLDGDTMVNDGHQATVVSGALGEAGMSKSVDRFCGSDVR